MFFVSVLSSAVMSWTNWWNNAHHQHTSPQEAEPLLTEDLPDSGGPTTLEAAFSKANGEVVANAYRILGRACCPSFWNSLKYVSMPNAIGRVKIERRWGNKKEMRQSRTIEVGGLKCSRKGRSLREWIPVISSEQK